MPHKGDVLPKDVLERVVGVMVAIGPRKNKNDSVKHGSRGKVGRKYVLYLAKNGKKLTKSLALPFTQLH